MGEVRKMSAIGKLALEDGGVYTGVSFGAEGEVFGEVCFNTSMVGYLEIITDPTYRNQIVVMTYPHIGSYGINEEDMQSSRVQAAGLVVREYSRMYSNYRAQYSLQEFLVRHGTVAIQGIDTRALTRRLRSAGTMKAVLSTVDLDDQSLVEKARAWPGLLGRDLTQEVMCRTPFCWNDSSEATTASATTVKSPLVRLAPPDKPSGQPAHVVCLDFGIKKSIARGLADAGCRVTIVPGTASAREILELHPDGIVLSNGPGDPKAVTYAPKTIRQLLGKRPILGVGLGHQLLALACGAETLKLKFGHHGSNYPVINVSTNRVEITIQNHGFSVDPDSLPDCLEVTHVNLNDQSVEGLRHRDIPAFGVQFHPTASLGPGSSPNVFQTFRSMIV